MSTDGDKPYLTVLCKAIHGAFVGQEAQLVTTFEKQVEGTAQLKHLLIQGASAEHIETQAGAGHGDDQAANITDVTSCLGTDQ